MDFEIDKFRFFVIDEKDKQRSCIWFIREKNDSIYISAKILGGFLKLSMHPSNSSKDGKDCQVGLTNGYTKKLKSKNYTLPKLLRWCRPKTPDKGATCVVSILFPTDYLKANIKTEKISASKRKLRFALPVAKKGCTVRVDVFYTKEQPDTITKDLTKRLFTVLGYITLPLNETVVISARHTSFDSATMPDLKSRSGTPLSGAPGPGETIKNAHAVMWTQPQDGLPIFLTEINGLTVENKA